jgi:hypothetical protein
MLYWPTMLKWYPDQVSPCDPIKGQRWWDNPEDQHRSGWEVVVQWTMSTSRILIVRYRSTDLMILPSHPWTARVGINITWMCASHLVILSQTFHQKLQRACIWSGLSYDAPYSLYEQKLHIVLRWCIAVCCVVLLRSNKEAMSHPWLSTTRTTKTVKLLQTETHRRILPVNQSINLFYWRTVTIEAFIRTSIGRQNVCKTVCVGWDVDCFAFSVDAGAGDSVGSLDAFVWDIDIWWIACVYLQSVGSEWNGPKADCC